MMFVFYRVSADLPENYATPLMYELKRRDRNCHLIYENTTAHRIRVCTSPVSTITTDRVDNAHYYLIRSLCEKLPSKCTLVVKDLPELGETADQASMVYLSLCEKQINLEFVDMPWMNSQLFELILLDKPMETTQVISRMIQNYFMWKECQGTAYDIISPGITQATNKVKKKSL